MAKKNGLNSCKIIYVYKITISFILYVLTLFGHYYQYKIEVEKFTILIN
jgi:hypothetical protein